MDEHLWRCLEAMRAATTESRRRKLATNTLEWELLDKVGKQLANSAIERMEASGDEDSQTTTPQRRVQRPLRRGRSNRGKDRRLRMLPQPSELFDEKRYSAGARLACAILIEALDESEQSAEFSINLNSLRQICKQGIHPVWRVLAEEASLFEELGYYPSASSKQVSVSEDFTWLHVLSIDPRDMPALATALDSGIPTSLPAESQLALRRICENSNRLKQAKGREWLRSHIAGESALLGLEAPWTLLVGVLLESSGSSGALEAFERAAEWSEDEVITEIATDQLALARLRRDDIDVWQRCQSASGEGSLAQAQRLEAWIRIGAVEHDLDVASLERARSELEQSGAKTAESALEAIAWSLLDIATQQDVLPEHHHSLRDLSPHLQSHIVIACRIMADGDDSADEHWLMANISGLAEPALSRLAQDDSLTSRIRLSASQLLKSRGSGAEVLDASTEVALQVRLCAITELIALLMDSDELAASHPLEVLLVHHLHPATSDESLAQWMSSARGAALRNLVANEPETTMTELAVTLLKLLEGARTELDPKQQVPKAILRLDKKGILAYKQCRFALRDGGRGYVEDKELENLSQSIQSAEIDELETGLFQTLLDTMRLNRAAHLLRGDPHSEEMHELMMTVFDRSEPRHTFIEEARGLILEHEIPLRSVLRWHQEHSPRSVWTAICKAAVEADDGDRRSSGNLLLESADSGFFDFEVNRSLYRRALIHFAHAGVWPQAVKMLDEHQDMAGVVTRKFRLYLNVSCDASQGNHRAATNRLLSFSEVSEQVESFDEEGQLRIETRKAPSLEILQSLLSYPSSHPDPLPEMPFVGRVRAALNEAGKRGRLTIDDLHRRFEDCLREEQYLEVNGLANRAAEKGKVVEAMHWMERAMRKANLQDSQKVHAAYNVFFQRYQSKIKVRKRRHLRSLGLKLLVLIDTNLLIDALADEVTQRLELSSESRLNLLGRGTFHRSVLDLHRAGRLELHVIPAIANHEFRVDGAMVANMFSEVLVDSQRLQAAIQTAELEKMRRSVLADFNDWNKQALLESDCRERIKTEVESFLESRADIYREITASKQSRNAANARTQIGGDEWIYPEPNDRKLMLAAAEFADSTVRDVGGVIVATRDSDFIMVARAFEERLGFGVVWNTKTLNAWLPES